MKGFWPDNRLSFDGESGSRERKTSWTESETRSSTKPLRFLGLSPKPSTLLKGLCGLCVCLCDLQKTPDVQAIKLSVKLHHQSMSVQQLEARKSNCRKGKRPTYLWSLVLNGEKPLFKFLPPGYSETTILFNSLTFYKVIFGAAESLFPKMIMMTVKIIEALIDDWRPYKIIIALWHKQKTFSEVFLLLILPTPTHIFYLRPQRFQAKKKGKKKEN